MCDTIIVASFEYDPWLEEFVNSDRFLFEWDSGNQSKNWRSHGVSTTECEEAFLNGALPVGIQIDPPVREDRYAIIGETFDAKPLFVVFTMRGKAVRVISARLATP